MMKCEVCNTEQVEIFECERCDKQYCDNCGASYNQFTQIDYDCCKPCGESMKGGGYDD